MNEEIALLVLSGDAKADYDGNGSRNVCFQPLPISGAHWQPHLQLVYAASQGAVVLPQGLQLVLFLANATG